MIRAQAAFEHMKKAACTRQDIAPSFCNATYPHIRQRSKSKSSLHAEFHSAGCFFKPATPQHLFGDCHEHHCPPAPPRGYFVRPRREQHCRAQPRHGQNHRPCTHHQHITTASTHCPSPNRTKTMGRQNRLGTRRYFVAVVSADERAQRKFGTADDDGARQKPGRIARRNRLRGRLCALVCRRSTAH